MPVNKETAKRKQKTTEDKILKELKNISKILQESKVILDAIWRERIP